jgi:hypothetical protein
LNLNGQSLYSTNMTGNSDQPMVNFYHILLPMSTSSLKNHFLHSWLYTLNMDVMIYDVYSTFDITNMWILKKIRLDTVVKCKILR